MPQLQFHIQFQKSTSSIINPDDIRKFYLFGINLAKQGVELTDDVYQFYIDSAVEQLQNYLGIKLQLQVIQESKDFYADDWQQWGYMRTSYPAVCAFQLTGFLGTVQQVDYPADWLSTRTTSDGQLYQRCIQVVPNGSNSTTQTVLYTGLLPSINYHANQRIPNYWTMTYSTGFAKVPADMLNVLGKLAALNILTMTGDAFLLYPGVSSQSISLDGLSQNLSSVANANSGVFGARIAQYGRDLFGDGKGNDGELKRLYDRYTTLTWGVG